MLRLGHPCALVALCLTSLARPAFGQDDGAGAGASLAELERLALQRFPEVEAAEARLRRLEAELAEVRWRPLSGVRLRGLVAPTPERRGDALHSAQGDISFSGSMGVLVRTELTASFPVYTFGRLTAERAAAREGVAAGREALEARRAETRLRVHQAYWGLRLAEETEALLDEGRGHVARAREILEARLEAEESGVTETDRLRVEVLDAELEARASDARRARRLAAASLALLAGLAPDLPLERAPLEPAETDLAPLTEHLDSARRARPELEGARARLRAATAEVRAARARHLPEVQLVGELGYSYASVVDDQQSPFANDPFNYLRYGLGVALRWNLDILGDRARVRQAEASRDVRHAEERSAEARVALEVEEAHGAVEEGLRAIEARRRARRAARGWMFAVLQGIDVGVLEPEELVESLRAYFEQSFRYLEAVARLNQATASLEVACGSGRAGAGR